MALFKTDPIPKVTEKQLSVAYFTVCCIFILLATCMRSMSVPIPVWLICFFVLIPFTLGILIKSKRESRLLSIESKEGLQILIDHLGVPTSILKWNNIRPRNEHCVIFAKIAQIVKDSTPLDEATQIKVALHLRSYSGFQFTPPLEGCAYSLIESLASSQLSEAAVEQLKETSRFSVPQKIVDDLTTILSKRQG